MINWIRKLFGICAHKWETFREVKVYMTDLSGKRSELPVQWEYHMRCAHCGELKCKKF